jgi:hypothetical protein
LRRDGRPAEPDGEAALLMLIRDPENDGALTKLAGMKSV